MRKTLLDELVKAKRITNYRGRCPVTDPPEKGGELLAIPQTIRAVVALWHRKRVLAMPKNGKTRCAADAAVAFLRAQEAESLEYIMCDWLRAHFNLGRRARITPCSRWRCSVQVL